MATASASPTCLLRVATEGGALGSWSDADLLAHFAATRGEPDDQRALAFEILVRRHGSMVWSVCRRTLLDPSDADDAFQATFLVLVRRAGGVRVGESLAPWLFGVARRVARRVRLDRDRRRRREGASLGAVADPPAPEAINPRLAEITAALDAEVARLPEPFRSALVLCDLDGGTIDQAAREFGCPPGTIKSRLHRARERLRRGLARRGFGDSPAQPAALGVLASPPDRLVRAVVARCAGVASSAPIQSLVLWSLFLDGASRMTSLLLTRWVAAATLSTTLGVLATIYLGQDPAAPAPVQPTAPPHPVPREFNKVSLPDYVVEPPDIIVVESLQALPGRSITGEHLIRPDGKISLGFYGELYVAGMTTTEVKVKVIEHLRAFLTEEVLGLKSFDQNGREKRIKAADSDRVFVDVTTYNSKVYYVQGSVASPGRFPVTGNETVLDALNFAGGFLFADLGRAEITLIRPAATAQAELQRLPVDLKAIVQGDTRTNYQMMPGDRLVVARTPPLTDEELGNARLLQKVQDQGARLDVLEKKLDRILEKLNVPAQPTGK